MATFIVKNEAVAVEERSSCLAVEALLRTLKKKVLPDIRYAVAMTNRADRAIVW